MDAFFINLKKSEADFSPTTMYRDYPISPTLFHWETQSTTSVASKTGRRYLNSESTVPPLRPRRGDGVFGTSPYLFLGPAKYVSHTGDRLYRDHLATGPRHAHRLLQCSLCRCRLTEIPALAVGGRAVAGLEAGY